MPTTEKLTNHFRIRKIKVVHDVDEVLFVFRETRIEVFLFRH